VRFDGVEMPPMRKGKAPDSILKHPDQAGAAKENQSSPVHQSPALPSVPPSSPLPPPDISLPPPSKILLLPTPLVRSTDTPPPSRTPLSSSKLSTAPSTSPSPSPSENYCLSPQRRGSSTRN
jgi:hypothetical protein